MSNVIVSMMAKQGDESMEQVVNTVRPLESQKVNGKPKSAGDETTALKARIAELETKLSQAAQPTKLTMKVSEKKAASLYGLGRWPVTLYYGQWQRIVSEITSIAAWLEAHKGELSMTKE